MDDGYNINQSWRQMDAETRKYWRSQWHETNVVYYNPNVDYEPWPSHAKETFPVADKNSPLVHPLQKKKLDLDKTSFTVDLWWSWKTATSHIIPLPATTGAYRMTR
jgi:hypothetical protein